MAVSGMDDTVGRTLDTTAETVVVAVVVVVTHIRSSLSVDCLPSSLLDSNLFTWEARRINGGPAFFYPNFAARVMVMARIYGRAGGPFNINLCGLPDWKVLSGTTEARVGISLFEPVVGFSNKWPCGFAVAPFSLVKNSL